MIGQFFLAVRAIGKTDGNLGAQVAWKTKKETTNENHGFLNLGDDACSKAGE